MKKCIKTYFPKEHSQQKSQSSRVRIRRVLAGRKRKGHHRNGHMRLTFDYL